MIKINITRNLHLWSDHAYEDKDKRSIMIKIKIIMIRNIHLWSDHAYDAYDRNKDKEL